MSDLEANSIEEKKQAPSPTPVEVDFGDGISSKPSWSLRLYLALQKLDQYGVESRGIERVPSDERKPATWLTWSGLSLIWYVSSMTSHLMAQVTESSRTSAGMGLSNFVVGLIGPLYYNLTLGQTVGILFGAGLLGSLVSGFLAIFGKKNGLRALANSRYTFGYYGAMIMAVLNIITEGAYGTQMGILGGQAMNVVSKGAIPVAGGIPLVVFCSWLIASGGHKFIHYWSRYFTHGILYVLSFEHNLSDMLQGGLHTSHDSYHRHACCEYSNGPGTSLAVLMIATGIWFQVYQ